MSARPAFGNEGEGQPLAQGAQADTDELWNQRSGPVRERSEVGDQVCVPEAGQLGQGGPRFGEWLRAHRLPDPFRSYTSPVAATSLCPALPVERPRPI